MTVQLDLFTSAATRCVLPGCRNLADATGRPCPACLAAFGDWLQPTNGPALTQQEVDARDDAVRAILRERKATPPVVAAAPERKANQTCWLCDERRTCTRRPLGWECDTCQEVS